MVPVWVWDTVRIDFGRGVEVGWAVYDVPQLSLTAGQPEGYKPVINRPFSKSLARPRLWRGARAFGL